MYYIYYIYYIYIYMHKYRKLNIHVPYSLELVTSLDSIFS